MFEIVKKKCLGPKVFVKFSAGNDSGSYRFVSRWLHDSL